MQSIIAFGATVLVRSIIVSVLINQHDISVAGNTIGEDDITVMILTGRPINDILVVLAWCSTTCCPLSWWSKSFDQGTFWTAVGLEIKPNMILVPAARIPSISGPSADSSRSSWRWPINSGSVFKPYRSTMYWSYGICTTTRYNNWRSKLCQQNITFNEKESQVKTNPQSIINNNITRRITYCEIKKLKLRLKYPVIFITN